MDVGRLALLLGHLCRAREGIISIKAIYPGVGFGPTYTKRGWVKFLGHLTLSLEATFRLGQHSPSKLIFLGRGGFPIKRSGYYLAPFLSVSKKTSRGSRDGTHSEKGNIGGLRRVIQRVSSLEINLFAGPFSGEVPNWGPRDTFRSTQFPTKICARRQFFWAQTFRGYNRLEPFVANLRSITRSFAGERGS